MTSYFKFSHLLITLALVFFTSAQAQTQAVETRYMKPPKLNEINLGEKIICYRPVRKAGPKIAVENIDNKVVIHNYGHGGAGWSLAPGSAQYVLSLLDNITPHLGLEKSTKITIIGAGVVGLFSAYTLLEAGFKHVTIIASDYDNLTSHHAGAIFSPGVGFNRDDEKSKALLLEIGSDSLKFYQAIDQNRYPLFAGGAKKMPHYFQTTKTPDLEDYVGKLINPSKKVLVDFGNGKTQEMIVYEEGMFIDTGLMMQQLTNHLKGKVSFQKAKINKFSDIKDDVIINCTGLGAKDLSMDAELMPAQGHLILLKNQHPEDLQQLMVVNFDPIVNEQGKKMYRMLYLFPKRLPGAKKGDIGVLGGTYIEGATNETPHQEEFDLMVQRAREFYGLNDMV